MSKSQCKALHDHLKSGKRITPLEALRMYGIGRLAARVPEVRIQYGMAIDKNMVPVIGGNGIARVAEYFEVKRSEV